MNVAELKKLKEELEAEGKKYLENKIIRGQIVMASLPILGNSVQHGLRPCVIISNNKANMFSPNVVLVPLTSRSKKPLPTHYTINPTSNNGLRTNSTALAEQIITISKSAIQKVIGYLDNEDMTNINRILKESISLL